MGARVTLADVDEGRLKLARQIGAAEAMVNSSGDGWEKQIEAGSFHVVIDVAGVVGMEDKLIAALVQRGRLMLIAGRFKVEYTFNSGQGRELQIRQNSHFDKSDLDLLRDYVGLGRIRLAPLIQKVASLGEARQVYDSLRDAPQTLMGTVFDWRP
jgi:threonine dehydrogenase-like Zn-dependent dehydrogenase